MIDLELNRDRTSPHYGDLVLEGRNLRRTDSTIQRLEQTLDLWRGDWFLNRDAGLPWLQDVLGRRPRPRVLGEIVRNVLMRDPDVENVEAIEADYTPSRGGFLRFTVNLRDGSAEDMEIDLG